MSGIVGQSDNVYLGGYPGPLRELAGIWVEEIDALASEQRNHILFKSGHAAECRMLCDIIHLEGAEMIAEYSSDFYSGTPAVTKNSFGKGQVYYIGSVFDQETLGLILNMATEDADITAAIEEETRLEIVCRSVADGTLYFIMNFEEEPQKLPQRFVGLMDIIDNKVLEKELIFKQYDVRLVKV